jgi:hypothetical protein
MKRLGEPEEIGNFIKGIIENNVKIPNRCYNKL